MVPERAGRWQSVLPANRDRAARQYAAGELPEGQEMQRVWQPRDPDALATRLGVEALTAWFETG